MLLDAHYQATKMATVLLSLTNLLSEPNPDDPLVTSVRLASLSLMSVYSKACVMG